MSTLQLPLNDTVLVFLYSGDCQTPTSHVVQVTVKAEKPETDETIATYRAVQNELTDMILRLITIHMKAPIPQETQFEDELYTLYAYNMPWSLGKKIEFTWGEKALEASEDKWVFVFETKRRVKLEDDSI